MCKTMPERWDFAFRFHSVDLSSPMSDLLNRCQQFTGTAASRRLQTGSLPVGALLNDVRKHKISLNFTLRCQIMIFGFNRECFEAALPDMALI